MSAKENYVIVTPEMLASYADNCRRDPSRRLFSVVFTKKNGQLRRMTIKPGKRATRGARAWDPERTGRRFVFEPRKGWRTLDLHTLAEVSVCGVRYVTASRWLDLNWGVKRIPFGGAK